MGEIEVYRLSKDIVNRFVPRKTVGVYRLGVKERHGFRVRYFGRSDTNLRKRLLKHADERRFTYFSFEETSTILEAFRQECREWHMMMKTENVIHPDAPKSLPYRCIYCMVLGAQIS